MNVIGREPAGRLLPGRELHAPVDLCAKADAPLCEGEVIDGSVESPAHRGGFEIAAGQRRKRVSPGFGGPTRRGWSGSRRHRPDLNGENG